jgi:hypothetical protein
VSVDGCTSVGSTEAALHAAREEIASSPTPLKIKRLNRIPPFPIE